MSGTPTSATPSRVGLKQLQRLLCFLRHELYGEFISEEENTTTSIIKKRKKEGKEDNGGGAQRFYRDILLPFVKHDMTGREALECLLKELMVRHRKVVKLLRVVQHYILSPWSHLC